MKTFYEALAMIGFLMILVGCICVGTIPGYIVLGLGIVAALVGGNKSEKRRNK